MNWALKKAIVESGLKQTFLSEKAGIDNGVLSHAIYGRRELDSEKKTRLAEILGRTLEELFPDMEQI